VFAPQQGNVIRIAGADARFSRMGLESAEATSWITTGGVSLKVNQQPATG
jgi:hypothetical protein